MASAHGSTAQERGNPVRQMDGGGDVNHFIGA